MKAIWEGQCRIAALYPAGWSCEPMKAFFQRRICIAAPIWFFGWSSFSGLPKRLLSCSRNRTAISLTSVFRCFRRENSETLFLKDQVCHSPWGIWPGRCHPNKSPQLMTTGRQLSLLATQGAKKNSSAKPGNSNKSEICYNGADQQGQIGCWTKHLRWRHLRNGNVSSHQVFKKNKKEIDLKEVIRSESGVFQSSQCHDWASTQT